MRRLALLAAGAVLAALAPTASAGLTEQRDRGGVPADLGLSKKERRALDIGSVRLFAQDGLGLVVVVNFKGNAERALGRGRLKSGAVAAVFNPRRGQAATGLVSIGDGDVLGKARSRPFGALRDGKKLTFFVQGGSIQSLASVEVRSFAADPRKRGAQAASERRLQGLGKFAANNPAGEADEAIVQADLTELDCEQLEDLENELESDLSLLDQDIRLLRKDIADLERKLRRAKRKKREQIERRLAGKREELAEAERNRPEIDDLRLAVGAEYDRRCGQTPPGAPELGGVFVWSFFGPIEVALRGTFQASPGPSASAVTDPITAVRVVVPPQGNAPRAITNMLCPSQLPETSLATTTNPNDTLVCGGGSLPVGQAFSLNVQTDPPPTTGMGGQIFGEQAGAFKGPFAITGP